MGRSFLDDREIVTSRGIKWLLRRGQLIDDAIRAGAWEPWSTSVVEHVVKPGMTCVDVGANMGYYTMLLAGLVGPAGHVYSAEPMLDPCEVIRRTVSLNGFGNVTILAGHAFGDEDTADAAPVFCNYSWPPADVDQHGNPVVREKIDTALGGVERLDFIKIDVDGYEARILQGARKMLVRFHPVLLLEVCDYTLRAAAGKASDPAYVYGQETRAMLEGLRTIDYRFCYEENWRPVGSVDEVLAKYNLAGSSTNLICLGEQHAAP